MDFVTYGSIIAIAIIALVIFLIVRNNSSQPAKQKTVEDRHSGSSPKSTRSPTVAWHPGKDDLTQTGKKSSSFAKKAQSTASTSKDQAFEAKSQGRSLSVQPASTSRASKPASSSFALNGGSNTFKAQKQQSSATNDSGVLLLLPTEADNNLNTRNAFKSPPGNLKIFSLYSDFVNEVSDDVLHVTDSFLHGINNLIDSDYHLVHDDEWRGVMEQNERLAHMTSRYVKRYRYPHYAGHIHQMLVTSLTTLTRATELINESFVNATNGERDQAQSKLKNSKILLNKSPKYLEYCNSAMGACFVELNQNV